MPASNLPHEHPLPFESHLKLAHAYWAQHNLRNACVVDATAGNGHDTLHLCKLVLHEDHGAVYAFDIQSQALENTFTRLKEELTNEQIKRVHLMNCCHSELAEISKYNSLPIRLIVYNLGYLPGGDKSNTTLVETTLRSLEAACNLLESGGLISITCYPGHPAGAIEEKALLEFTSKLPRKVWNCCHHRWVNRTLSPSLLLLQKH